MYIPRVRSDRCWIVLKVCVFNWTSYMEFVLMCVICPHLHGINKLMSKNEKKSINSHKMLINLEELETYIKETISMSSEIQPYYF